MTVKHQQAGSLGERAATDRQQSCSSREVCLQTNVKPPRTAPCSPGTRCSCTSCGTCWNVWRCTCQRVFVRRQYKRAHSGKVLEAIDLRPRDQADGDVVARTAGGLSLHIRARRGAYGDPAFQLGEPIEYLESEPWIVEFWHVISDPAFE